VDAIDRLVMNTRLHYPWSAARIVEPVQRAFAVFDDPIAAVGQDVGRLRLDLHLAHRDKIRGFIYDLAANTMTEVHS
jgi:hypothetical protein